MEDNALTMAMAAKVLYGGILGTTVMTAFSYFLSFVTGHNYKEPKNLYKLFHNLYPASPREKFIVLGWLIHYLVGVVFVAGYAFMWTHTAIPPSLLSGAVLGGISGVLGAAIWHITLTIHPDPPQLNRRQYYLQLVPAHIIFGIFAYIGYVY